MVVQVMIAEASAPGKVILFGEHAVVYGISAIAASVSSLRVSTRVTIEMEPNAVISLNNLVSKKDGQPLARSWPLRELEAAVRDVNTAFLLRPSKELTDALNQVLNNEHPKDANALRPALFLLLAIMPDIFESTIGVRLSVTSGEFPVGAGLGSSAAFCVSVAAALFRCREADPNATIPLEKINEHAFAAEVLLHDDPSGVDNTVATFGGAIVYRKNPQFMETFSMPKLRILLTNTHVPRETKVLVAGVRALHTANPEAIEAQFDIIEKLATDFQREVKANTLIDSTLSGMISANQVCLDAMQVGHSTISTICDLSAKYNMPTKLTGAGGGGCTITLIPADANDDDVALLKYELTQAGFTCLETALGGPGVECRLIQED